MPQQRFDLIVTINLWHCSSLFDFGILTNLAHCKSWHGCYNTVCEWICWNTVSEWICWNNLAFFSALHQLTFKKLLMAIFTQNYLYYCIKRLHILRYLKCLIKNFMSFFILSFTLKIMLRITHFPALFITHAFIFGQFSWDLFHEYPVFL